MRTFDHFMAHLRAVGAQPNTVVDVGVAWGTPALYAAFPEAYLVLVEALPYFEDHLKRIISKRRGEYHLKAVADQPGQTKINVHKNAQALAGVGIYHNSRGDLSYDVEITTLDSLLRVEDLSTPILMKIDVQGADLNALRGARRLLSATEIVIAEASFVNPRNLVGNMIRYMDELEFQLYEICGARNRPYDNALGQVDLGFVRKTSSLVSYKGWT